MVPSERFSLGDEGEGLVFTHSRDALMLDGDTGGQERREAVKSPRLYRLCREMNLHSGALVGKKVRSEGVKKAKEGRGAGGDPLFGSADSSLQSQLKSNSYTRVQHTVQMLKSSVILCQSPNTSRRLHQRLFLCASVPKRKPAVTVGEEERKEEKK